MDVVRVMRCALLVLLAVLVTRPGHADDGASSFERWVEGLTQEAVELRQMRLLEPVRARLISREELVQEIMDQLALEYSPEDLRDGEDALAALGVWPDGLTLETLLLELYQDQVAGFYSPLDRTLRLLEDTPLSQQAPIALHEIVHALQDQHVPLMEYRLARWSITDLQLARTAVVEGDAMAAMAQWVSGGAPTLIDVLNPTARRLAESFQPPSMRHVPAVIWQSTVFPYVSGMHFVNTLLAEAGWKGVDAAFHRGPLSTREVMEPALWSACWEPVWLDGAWVHALEEGWEVLDHDILGQRMLQVVLGEQLRRSVPARVLAQVGSTWRGDRLVVRRSEYGALEAAWAILTESPMAAENLADLLRDGARLRHEVAEEMDGSNGVEGASRRWVVGAGGGAVIEVQGALVVAVLRSRTENPGDTLLRTLTQRVSFVLQTLGHYRYPEAVRRDVTLESMPSLEADQRCP